MQDLPTPKPDALACKVPDAWFAHFERNGWVYAASNSGIVFFDRPGYWLRLYATPEHAWYVTVLPECAHIRGDCKPFDALELAPLIQGRGARQRALELALSLWHEHESYLAALGIELNCVGVRQNRSSGGRGSAVGRKSYYRRELFPAQEEAIRDV